MNAHPFRRFVFVVSMTSLFSARAGEVALPEVPASAFADTESVTNAALPARAMASARLVRCMVELAASASNCVEVAFGTDADEDGALAGDEVAMRLGWDSGAWFLEGGTNRFEAAVAEPPTPVRLELSLRVDERGAPVAGSCGAFTNLPARPPSWLFSREWDSVRLAVRGFGPRDESVSVRLDADASVMILR